MSAGGFAESGDFVYLPEGDWHAVTREILRHHPPGTLVWGTNRSKWKEGQWYVWGDAQIPLEELVRSAVEHETTVEVVAKETGLAFEGEEI